MRADRDGAPGSKICGRAVITRAAFENAIAAWRRPAARPTRCCTCWRSRARPGSSCPSTTSTRSAARRRYRRSETGRALCRRRYRRAGGMRLLVQRSSTAGCCTDSPRLRADACRRGGGLRARRRGRRSSAARSRSNRRGGLAILRGRSRPKAAWSSWPGTSGRITAGRRACSTREEAVFAAVQAREIKPGDVVVIRYEGPVGRPGDARDAGGHRRRSSARGSATASRCSPTDASRAPRTA